MCNLSVLKIQSEDKRVCILLQWTVLPFSGLVIFGLVVRVSASSAAGHGFDPRLQQTKVFKTGSSGFPPRAQLID